MFVKCVCMPVKIIVPGKDTVLQFNNSAFESPDTSKSQKHPLNFYNKHTNTHMHTFTSVQIFDCVHIYKNI